MGWWMTALQNPRTLKVLCWLARQNAIELGLATKKYAALDLLPLSDFAVEPCVRGSLCYFHHFLEFSSRSRYFKGFQYCICFVRVLYQSIQNRQLQAIVKALHRWFLVSCPFSTLAGRHCCLFNDLKPFCQGSSVSTRSRTSCDLTRHFGH